MRVAAESPLAVEVPAVGRVVSLPCDDPREHLSWLQLMHSTEGFDLLMLTRLAPQKLAQWMPLAGLDFHWLSEQDSVHAIQPALERLYFLLQERTAKGGGLIWIDAFEYLSAMHGFESVLNFIRSIQDLIVDSDWSVILPFTPLALEAKQAARLRREAVPLKISTKIVSSDDSRTRIALTRQQESKSRDLPSSTKDAPATADVVAAGAQDAPTSTDSSDLTRPVEVAGTLQQLSRIPESAMTRGILRRRMEQWQSMGFDVSDIEHALTLEREQRYHWYAPLENLVRHAVELEARICKLEQLNLRTDSTKMRFRIMQLTGLDDIEEQLEDLLSEESTD